jgi:hypothetical protein
VSASGSRVGQRVGQRVGVQMGRAGGALTGMALYLPSLYGVYPIYHADSTTPNEDGAVSAVADASLGLYPVSQGTGGNQPLRGSGLITFDGTDDCLSTTDATVLAYGNLTSHGCGFLASLAVTAPASAADVVCAWVIGTQPHRLELSAAERLRPRKGALVGESAGQIFDGTQRSTVIDWQSGANGDVLCYVAGALDYTLPITGAGTGAPTLMSFGALAAGLQSANIAMRAWCVTAESPTAQMRTEWDAYVAAGCPL